VNSSYILIVIEFQIATDSTVFIEQFEVNIIPGAVGYKLVRRVLENEGDCLTKLGIL
jgi:hypothetical protein